MGGGSWTQVSGTNAGKDEWYVTASSLENCKQLCNNLHSWGSPATQSHAPSGCRYISFNAGTNHVTNDGAGPGHLQKCAPANLEVDHEHLSSPCTPATLSCSGNQHPDLHEGGVRKYQTVEGGVGNKVVYEAPKHSGPGSTYKDYSSDLGRTGTPPEMFAHNQPRCYNHIDGWQHNDGTTEAENADRVGNKLYGQPSQP